MLSDDELEEVAGGLPKFPKWWSGLGSGSVEGRCAECNTVQYFWVWDKGDLSGGGTCKICNKKVKIYRV